MLCLFVLVLRLVPPSREKPWERGCLVCYVISLNARASCVNQSDHTSSFFLSDENEKKS